MHRACGKSPIAKKQKQKKTKKNAIKGQIREDIRECRGAIIFSKMVF